MLALEMLMLKLGLWWVLKSRVCCGFFVRVVSGVLHGSRCLRAAGAVLPCCQRPKK